MGSGGAPAGRNNDKWRQADWRLEEALEVLRILAERYAGRSCVTGLQVANEPSRDCRMSDMCLWFERAIRTIRDAGMRADRVAIVLPVYDFLRLEEFVVSWGARGNFLRFENVVIDLHYYHVFLRPVESLSHEQHMTIVERHGRVLRSLPGAVVGEWSLCRPDELEATDEMRQEFGNAQLRAYAAASHGWFFWNYCDAQDMWDVDTCIERGWLPSNFGSMSELRECCRMGCTEASPQGLLRTPPPGRFPQCYGSEERRVLAEMQSPGCVGSSPPRGQKRLRCDSRDAP